MVYKFLVGSEEAENFKLEIMIDSEDTFMRLRNTILDAAGYDKDQVDSFYICDEEWNKDREVTVIGKEIKYIYDMRRKEDEKTDQEKRNRLADVWNNDDGGGIYRMREKRYRL